MPDTTETSQAERFKNRYAARLAHSLAIDPDDVEISDAFAAYLFALDLIAGDSERCKAGYSPSNALLAAIEVFGISVGEGVAARLGIPFESPATGGATNLEDRDAPERSGGGSQCRCR